MKTYKIVTNEDAAMLEKELKGCIVSDIGITTNETAIQLYFTDGSCIMIQGATSDKIGVNAKLEVEYRRS